MVVGIKYLWEMNGKKGIKYTLCIDGTEYDLKGNEDKYNSIPRDIEFEEVRYYDKSGLCKISYK